MPIKTIAREAIFSPEKMAKTGLFESERFFCDVYGLEPGQSQKPHAHEGSDKIYAVIEGSVRVRIGTEDAVAGAGTVAHVPAGAVPSIENAGAGRATLLVFMAPRP
jgi:quercetin dioxygenase-like cupin family protein